MLIRTGKRTRALPVALAALSLALAGCSGDDADAGPTGATSTAPILQGAAPGEPNTTITAVPEMPDLVIEADLAFVRKMLLHHDQAVEMTALVPDRSSRDDVPLFAERIAVSQEDEMKLMQEWLRERGEPVFDLESGGGHQHLAGEMRGMLTPTQLEQLKNASGQEFDILFLQFMYYHHEGAVAMVEELLEAEGAQDTFMHNLAKEIDNDQRIEMDRMIEMLAEMGEAPLSSDG